MIKPSRKPEGTHVVDPGFPARGPLLSSFVTLEGSFMTIKLMKTSSRGAKSQ
jgi:hypothetical protein